MSHNALITSGCLKFRFIDMSGCETKHSPKDREDHKVLEADAKDVGTFGNARRGHTKIVEDGQTVGWAKRTDKPLFEAAETVIKGALREASGLIQRCSIRVGGARAVPATRYEDFLAAKARCTQIAQEANAHPSVLAANESLVANGKPAIHMVYSVGMYPELSLSDPEDVERAERIRASVAEAIALVCAACRSGEREQIRYVLDQVGALGDSVSDPVMAENVRSLLIMAENTVEAITARGRAQGAIARANAETPRGQQAADRFLAAQKAETEAKQALTEVVNRFNLLEVSDEIPPERQDAIAAEIAARKDIEEKSLNRFGLLETEEQRQRTPEEELEYQAALRKLEASNEFSTPKSSSAAQA